MFQRNTQSTGRISLIILLSGLVVLCVLSTTILHLVGGYRSERSLLFSTTLELNYTNAREKAETMDSLLEAMKQSLRVSADYFGRYGAELSMKEVEEQLTLIRSGNRYFNAMSIVDEHGYIRSISPPTVRLVGQQLTYPRLRNVLEHRKPYISEPFTASTGRLMIIITEPIFDDLGNYGGFVSGVMYLREKNVFNAIFGNDTVSESGSYFYIVDDAGKIIFHPDDSRLEDDVSSNPVVRELMKGNHGRSQVVNTLGVPFLAGYSPVEENGWGIVSQTPLEGVQNMLWKQTLQQIAYVVPLCALFLGIAVLLARRLAEPFVKLANIAGRLSAGERVTESLRTNHWNREADMLSRSLQVAVRSMQRQQDRLTTQAFSDKLTGLANRRALDAALEDSILSEEPFTILIIDIDSFKSINDTLGHTAGDEVLRWLASTVTSALRPADVCYRYGGEEFVVLMRGVQSRSAVQAAERIRSTVEQSVSPVLRAVTVSIGVAGCPEHAEDAVPLFECADRALYEAKEAGRNRIMLAKKDLP